jgi:hypothetical protein
MTTVTVFAFKVYHALDGKEHQAPGKATLENIRTTIPYATEIPGTGEQVDESQLDGNGFYHPKPIDPELREDFPETGSTNDPDLGQFV